MSTILQMLAVNARLAEYESFEREVAGGKYRGSWSAKQPEKLAKAIFAQLSHVKAVEILVREWDSLPAQIRLELSNLCNTGNASGNVRKNVQLLDQKLGGRVLREAKHTEYINVRREGADGVRYEKKAVNPAVQGAHRKYQKV